MRGWKETTKRKKIQRHINSVLRNLNKNIERDNLWLGRFYCHQKNIRYEMSEDGSYRYAKAEIEFIDRKIGRTLIRYFDKEDFMGSTWRIWCAMNDFIVEYCDVWNEDPRPSVKNPWDYRKELRK